MLSPMNRPLPLSSIPSLMLALGVGILALDPLRWLANTWVDPSYDSDGLRVFLLIALLLGWSLSSPRYYQAENRPWLPVALLGTTALIRLLGQVLAINIIGALALVVDLYALGLLFGLHQRQRALSPAWMALLFACALPMERVVQRTLGYGLQQLSTWSSCSMLTGMADGVSCQGTRIQLPSETLLIDLPCSGTSALILLSVFLGALMAVARPSRWQGFMGIGLMLAAAWISNSFRILLLATGVLHPIPNVDVMVQPWHEVVGLASLMPAFALLILFFLWIYRVNRGATPVSYATSYRSRQPFRLTPKASLLTAVAFLFLAAVVVTRMPKPLDVGVALETPYAPSYLDGEVGQLVPLLDKEQRYFQQFGGAAIKVQYGERGLLITQTQSPLRHLHAPDECLRGLGFGVEYLGSRNGVVPTAVYRATSPDGRVWRVSVSFISADGKMATHVAEAVWHWFQTPQRWMSVQRIVPWDSPIESDQDWDQHLFSALDFPLTQPQPVVSGEQSQHI